MHIQLKLTQNQISTSTRPGDVAIPCVVVVVVVIVLVVVVVVVPAVEAVVVVMACIASDTALVMGYFLPQKAPEKSSSPRLQMPEPAKPR